MLFCGAMNLFIGGTIAAVLAVVMTLGPSHKSDASVVFTNISASLTMLATAWMLAWLTAPFETVVTTATGTG